ncbi:MAG: calcium-binding protein, partial [Planctomycetota bacterium]|nr:calcium-binding protein [Planctomycetota bacterium]
VADTSENGPDSTPSGNDFITAGAGNDTVYGHGGVDNIFGEGGMDLIFGNAGGDFIFGGEDADEIHGNAGDDQIEGNEGDDMIFGNGGNDLLNGGAGMDTIFGDVEVADTSDNGPASNPSGDDQIFGGEDADTIYGHGGADFIAGEGGDDMIFGNAGDDFIFGGLGADVIRGNAGNDQIQGNEGDDQIFGNDGDDVIMGNEDNDTIQGNAGADTIEGNAGDDLINGNDGDDVISGNEDADTIFGDDGADFIFGNAGEDTIQGGFGTDFIEGGSENDVIYGDTDDKAGDLASPLADETFADQIFGNEGDDLIFGGRGNDFISGGEGDDDIYGDYDFETGLTHTDLRGVPGADGDFIQGDAGEDIIFGSVRGDTILGNENNDRIYGGSGADLIFAGADDDQVYGGFGEDEIRGESGNDYIEGNEDADTIFGNEGNDLVLGGLGDDVISGDAGRDELRGDEGADQIFGGLGADLILGGLGNDQLFGNEDADIIRGNEGDDIISGGDANDLLYGDDGVDTIDGDLGNDVLYGGDGGDTLRGGENDDVLYGELGDDTLLGQNGNDQLFGDAGVDFLVGGEGDDQLVAGSGIGDALFGEGGDDLIFGSDEVSPFGGFIESGVTAQDFIDLGEMLGSMPPEEFVATNRAPVLGDVIFGGDGNDRIYSLAGADIVDAGAGNDFVYAGEGFGDQIFGGDGDDEIYGSHLGNDFIDGGADDDFVNGQGGMDVIFGNTGNDHLSGGADADRVEGGEGDDLIEGGGGDGDFLDGGLGNDLIQGSDDGGDQAFGGPGNDRIFGNGGNDFLNGGEGEDTIFGGDGDDLINGDAGPDLLIGGANHDVIYGFTEGVTADDNANDVIYGDSGTGLPEANPGRDQIFAGGGSDQLFGEQDDDYLDPGPGRDELTDFGPGEGPIASDFIPPAPTPQAVPLPQEAISFAGLTLPNGASNDDGQRWAEFFGSASDEGVSGDEGISDETDVAASSSAQHIVWVDTRRGASNIYYLQRGAALRNGSVAFSQLAGSEEEGGVSDTSNSSRRPAIALDATGAPIIAWTEFNEMGGSDIQVATFDGSDWVQIGDSLTPGGISDTGAADFARIVATDNGPVVAWVDSSSGQPEVFVRMFDGANWVEIGASSASSGGVSDSLTNGFSGVREVALSTDGTSVAASWTANSDGSGLDQIYLREFDGAAWNAIDGSGSGEGLSDSSGDSSHSTVAYHDGTIFVAWQDTEPDTTEIFAKFLDAGMWVEAGPLAASLGGVSRPGLTDPRVDPTEAVGPELPEFFSQASKPELVSDGTSLTLFWIAEDPSVRGEGRGVGSVFQVKWEGPTDGFGEELPGDASFAGISESGGYIRSLAVAAAENGNLYAAWNDTIDGTVETYFRGNEFSINTVIEVANDMELAAAAAAATMGDVITLAAGFYADPLTISTDGVLFLGSPDAQTFFTGPVNLVGATHTQFKTLVFFGAVTFDTMTSGVSVRDSAFLGASLDSMGAANVAISHSDFVNAFFGAFLNPPSGFVALENNFFDNVSNAVIVNGAVPKLLLLDNQVNLAPGGGTGFTIGGFSSGSITGNTLVGGDDGTGIAIPIGFDGPISHNDISGFGVGIDYQGPAPVGENFIHANTVGVNVVAGAPQIGFGAVGDLGPNVIE